MRRPRSSGLVSLRAAAGEESPQARLEASLRRSWLLVVGPALVGRTRLLRVKAGVLVVGCWEPHLIPSLRRSAEETWPQVRERLQRTWRTPFRAMEIVPCDPPPPPEPPKPPREGDLLKLILAHWRSQKKG